VAALLGKHLAEIDAMPASEFDRWALYWTQEPWGPYRDNMHAAMLAVQILKPHVKDPKKLNPSDFMYRAATGEDEIKRRNALSFYHLLKSQAVRKGAPKRLSMSQRR
jgi:hypothetical protein